MAIDKTTIYGMLLIKTTTKTLYMAFNTDKFYKTKFERPSADYPAPEFKDWFDEGDKPVFKIRGLTAFELNTSQNAEESVKATENVIEAIGQNYGKNKEAVNKLIAEIMGKNQGEEDENGFTARMKQTLAFGLVEPDADLSLINKMVEFAPVQMMTMFYKITELTAKVGVDAKKKQKDSGDVNKSEQ